MGKYSNLREKSFLITKNKNFNSYKHILYISKFSVIFNNYLPIEYIYLYIVYHFYLIY